MDEEKRIKLEVKGWNITSAAEFLKLTQEEEEIIEQRIKEIPDHSILQVDYRNSAESDIR